MKTVSVELSSVKNIKEKSLLIVTIGRYTIGRYTIGRYTIGRYTIGCQLVLIDIMETSEMTLSNLGRMESRNFMTWECTVNFILM